MIGDKAKPSAVDVYHNRFEYAHWADILSLIREKSGPALSGHMAKYNSVDLTVCDNQLYFSWTILISL